MKEIKRIPATADHLALVYTYGILHGIKNLIERIVDPKNKEEALKMFYEMNSKPTGDIARKTLETENALTFNPASMEFIIFDAKPDEVNYEIALKTYKERHTKEG